MESVSMVSLQEWLTNKYCARLQREWHRDDSAPIELLTDHDGSGICHGQRASGNAPRSDLPTGTCRSPSFCPMEGLGLVARARADPWMGCLLTQLSTLRRRSVYHSLDEV